MNTRTVLLVLVSGTASAQSYVPLSGPLARETSKIESWTVTPDGIRAVFERTDPSSARGVFSAPLDGGAEVPLSAGLPGKTQGFALSPDGSRVVLLTRPGTSSARRLHVVPTEGGTPKTLSGSPDVSIGSFRIAPGGDRVVYLASTAPSGHELWSVPLDGSAAPVRLNPPLPAGRTLLGEFKISLDGLRVFYTADQEADEVYDLFSVPIDRSQPPVRLNVSQPWADVAGLELAFDGQSVVYLADQDTDGVRELYVTDAAGGGLPVRCSGPIAAGGNVTSFRLAAASHRLVFVADAEQDERFELYALDPTVPGTPVKLSGTLANDRDVLDARISGDGLRVVYRSNQDALGQVELHVVPATGGARVTLNGPLAAGESVLADYVIEGASGRVLFHRDMGAPAFNARQLYGAPLDGSQPALRLNGPLVERGQAALLEACPEGALFSATEVAGEAFLFRAPLAGGAPLRLSPVLPAGSSVTAARLVPGGDAVVLEAGEELLVVPIEGGAPTFIPGSRVDGARAYGAVRGVTASREHAVYAGVQAPDRAEGVYSVRLDGSEAPRRLGRGAGQSHSLVLDRDRARVLYLASAGGVSTLYSARLGVADSEVALAGDAEAFDGNVESVTDFALAPDGDTVIHALRSAGSLLLRRVPLDGGAPAEELASWPDPDARLHLSPDGGWLVLAGPAGLYSLPVDGHQPPQRLDPGATTFPHVALTADSTRVVFAFTGAGNGLVSAALDGASAPVQLGASPVGTLELTHDGAGVLFTAEDDLEGTKELFHAPLDGASPATWLGGPRVLVFQEDPLSGRVVFYDSATELLAAAPLDGGPMPLASTRLMWMEGAPMRIVGGRVLYLGWQISCNSYESFTRLYSVPVMGGAAPVRLDFGSCSLGVLPRVEPFDHGRSVLFVHRPSQGDARELYRVPIDGSAPARRIVGPHWQTDSLTSTSPDQAIELTPDQGQLLCRTEVEGTSGAVELHALRLAPRARSRR